MEGPPPSRRGQVFQTDFGQGGLKTGKHLKPEAVGKSSILVPCQQGAPGGDGRGLLAEPITQCGRDEFRDWIVC